MSASLTPARGARPPVDPRVYARRNRRRFLAELVEFLRIPSVSAEPARAGEVARAARWLAGHLRGIGLEHVRVRPLPGGHPIVYADWRRAGPGRPTVLIYGHYDVVAPGPAAGWRSPPFVPTVRGDNLHARGACDDKGQLFTHVKALEAFLRTRGKLPVNVRCLFEGEEEVGSPHLDRFLSRHRRALAADVAVMSDTRFLGPDRPAVIRGLRGRLGLEVEVRRDGPEELHSGQFGGAVPDPARVLCRLVAGLHDPRSGRIAVPGFYDRVRRRLPARGTRGGGEDDAQLLRDAGLRLDPGTAAPPGELGWSRTECATVRPALTVNGLAAGAPGPGAKGVIPAAASAKLEFRLVPDQDPAELAPLVREHLASLQPPGVRVRVRPLGGMARPFLVARGEPALRAAAVAYRRGFGVSPAFVRSGGTIPVTQMFRERLGIPTVLLGFGLPDDRLHGPDEKFHLPNFYRGIETCLWFLAATGRLLAPRPTATRPPPGLRPRPRRPPP